MSTANDFEASAEAESVQVQGLLTIPLKPEAGVATFVDAARLHVGSFIAGSSSGDKRIKVDGFNFTNAVPMAVLTQPRQSDNVEQGYPDQFAVQIIETSTTSILVRIRRLDVGANETGWGQDLRVDMLIID